MNIKETYNRIAEDWVRDHEKDTWGKAGIDQFLSFIPKGATLLDVGCAGGNKTEYMREQGYVAEGLDLSEKMIELAKRDFPKCTFTVLDMHDIDQYLHVVDGILVQAALLHVPKKDVPTVLAKMKEKLNPDGVLYIAVKSMRENGVEEEVKTENDYGYDYSRFFSYFTAEELQKYFKDLEMNIIWEGSVGTSASKWLQIIAKK